MSDFCMTNMLYLLPVTEKFMEENHTVHPNRQSCVTQLVVQKQLEHQNQCMVQRHMGIQMVLLWNSGLVVNRTSGLKLMPERIFSLLISRLWCTASRLELRPQTFLKEIKGEVYKGGYKVGFVSSFISCRESRLPTVFFYLF